LNEGRPALVAPGATKRQITDTRMRSTPSERRVDIVDSTCELLPVTSRLSSWKIDSCDGEAEALETGAASAATAAAAVSSARWRRIIRIPRSALR
jgi:hypothetical protein